MTWGKLLFFEKTGSIKRRRYASTRDWMEIEKANLYVACRSLEAMWCAVNRVLESRHPDSRQNICRSRFTGRDYILSFRRVWFWLRTNAGGVDKTCKSNEILSKACFAKSSGERVSNTWATCPEAGDKPPKGGLIPYVISRGISWGSKRGSFYTSHFWMGSRPIS